MDTALIGKPKIDAYVKIDHKGNKLKTKVLIQQVDGQIDWNQQFLIPVQVPIMGGRLVFKVMDEDTVCDEVVGSILLNAKNYIDDKICNVPDKKGKVVQQLDYDDDNAKAK